MVRAPSLTGSFKGTRPLRSVAQSFLGPPSSFSSCVFRGEGRKEVLGERKAGLTTARTCRRLWLCPECWVCRGTWGEPLT